LLLYGERAKRLPALMRIQLELFSTLDLRKVSASHLVKHTTKGPGLHWNLSSALSKFESWSMGMSNPKQAAGEKKLPLQLVPPAASKGIAVALGEGAAKYGPWNWRAQPVEAMTYVGAIRRHLDAWVNGEDVDPDSAVGKLHLEGVIGSVAIMLDALACSTLIDNRPPKGKQ
jgi:hypothetical protein